MSLREKLKQKKEVKEKQMAEGEINKITEKEEKILVRIEKIQRLKGQLVDYYSQGKEGLDDYKIKKEEKESKKEELDAIFNENKDVLNSEGIDNVEEMITNNSEEEEVEDYQRSVKEKKESSDNLRNEVLNISQIKNALKDELPELNLKFTGGKLDKEKSNRDISLEKIDTYLEGLKKEIEKIQEEKKEYKLQTVEGRKEECKKDLEIVINKTFDRIDYERLRNFHLSNINPEFVDKYGEETVKEVLQEELSEKLEKYFLIFII